MVYESIDIEAVRKAMVGQYVWYLWDWDETAEDGDDVWIHRIIGVCLGEDFGKPCLVYHTSHPHGVHDNTMQNFGHVRVGTGKKENVPLFRCFCLICCLEEHKTELKNLKHSART